MPVLRQMVSFQNRVVHLYWNVSDSTVYDIIQQNLDDFDTYVGYILKFIDDQSNLEKSPITLLKMKAVA
jgi:uncharacterized protein YutE (UPF0331/DUF86 family)